MDKYGVEEDVSEDLEKKASQGCPKCGSTKVTQHGKTLVCPNCGTEPWEEENKK